MYVGCGRQSARRPPFAKYEPALPRFHMAESECKNLTKWASQLGGRSGTSRPCRFTVRSAYVALCFAPLDDWKVRIHWAVTSKQI